MAAPSPPLEPPPTPLTPSDLARLMVHSLPEGMRAQRGAGEGKVEAALRAVFSAAGAPAFQQLETLPDNNKQVRL